MEVISISFMDFHDRYLIFTDMKGIFQRGMPGTLISVDVIKVRFGKANARLKSNLQALKPFGMLLPDSQSGRRVSPLGRSKAELVGS